MPLDAELIRILACPKCKGKIELEGDGKAFVCNACRLKYAVEDDIPNFIIEEATPV